MFKQQGVHYDLANKRVGYAIGIGPVVYAAPATGIEKPADLAKAEDAPDLWRHRRHRQRSAGLLAFELLGLDVKTVLGFQGRGPIRLAFERGETNFDFQFTSVYLTQVQGPGRGEESGAAVHRRRRPTRRATSPRATR